MQVTSAEAETVFDAEHWALFLDFDGTLVDIAPTPDSIFVPADLMDLLAGMSRRLDGAIAVVTGREIKFIDGMIKRAVGVVAGVHGAEIRLPDGTFFATADKWLTRQMRDTVEELTRLYPALVVEQKDLAIAVHFRLAPELADVVKARLCTAVDAADGSLVLQPGRMVFEILPANVSKGRALTALMDSEPFRGRRPLAIGDDITDESMFAAAQEFGGAAIRVGDLDVPTVATLRLPDPSGVRGWLRRQFLSSGERPGESGLLSHPSASADTR